MKIKSRMYFFSLFIALTLVLNTACIHVKSHETKAIASELAPPYTQLKKEALEIQYWIYQPVKLPLSQFFFHLKRGDYKKAFQKMDLQYHSSNSSDKLLAELVDHGLVPVYVRIKNISKEPVAYDEKSFSLTHADGAIQAFYADQLPKEFESFNSEAFLANAYNTGVVVVGFALLLAVFIVATPHVGSLSPNADHLTSSNSSSSDEIYNHTQKKLYVNYSHYLISKTNLQPGEEGKGLLFFVKEDSDINSHSQLKFSKH